jgi:hypothetical protein
MPKARFIGKTYDLKKDPEGPRKLLTLDKYEKREDGTWRRVKATSIGYEDGSEIELGAPILIKPHEGEKGTQRHNIYFMEDEESDADEFSDDAIPF